jgi:hypothetical protein
MERYNGRARWSAGRRFAEMKRKKIRIGDRITFTVTTRAGRRRATRKVIGFNNFGHPEVGYGGYSNFVVGCFPGDIIHSVEA